MPSSPAPRLRLVALAASLALASLTAPAVLTDPAAGAAPAYSEQTLHFAVKVGPGLSQACDIVGLLFTPTTASPTHRVPALLTTNGFGGSDVDGVPFAQAEATRGYEVLSYSGLGFGGSGCKITLDDPAYDGQAASQLVSYLGGAPGIAFTDAAHTMGAPTLQVVIHDRVDHVGVAHRYDPRVGMWGGSYGGEVQFAAASVDPRIDVLNPQITWNDLSYSLAPNNAGQTHGVTGPTPGGTKTDWVAGFSTEGLLDGLQYAPNDPARLIGCPNFADFVCPALVSGASTGFLQPDAIASLRHASVSTYLSRIHIPVLLDQGQDDTLFNLNEAVATYAALRAQHTPVDMLWREQGHSGGTPTAAGLAYENARIQAWFDHYLKNSPVKTGSGFAYYQDWTGTWAQAKAYPVGAPQRYYLSGAGQLTASREAVTAGTAQFVTPPAGAPTSLGSPDAFGSLTPTPLDYPDVVVPGTYASWQTPALARPVTVVGSPTLDVRLAAPAAALTSAAGPAGELVLFAKIYDVSPTGAASLIHGLVAPVRIADPNQPLHIVLPGIAHRFAAGHHIEVMLAGGDLNYRGGLVATLVTVTTGSPAQLLTLPVVS